MGTLVQFGAGNIGRSFIGQLFSRAGYEVIFVDINKTVIDAMNAHREYRLIIKRNDMADETVLIKNVRGILASDADSVAEALSRARIAATAVGQNALTHILPLIAKGLVRRQKAGGGALDIILAENIRNGAAFVRKNLAAALPADHDLESIGLVETSIGKMVPIMRDEDMRIDPLWVFAEAYNNLIVDKCAFRNPIPDIPGIAPKENMAAYVDRKLFIHNLGHAAAAYAGFAADPSRMLIWQVLELPDVAAHVRDVMQESAQALIKEYPGEFTDTSLNDHINDLITRFRNKALGDTVFRVGRDLARKLGKNDRIIGAIILAAKHGIACDAIVKTVHDAIRFRAADEHGELFAQDKVIIEAEFPKGVRSVLTSVCGLSEKDAIERTVMDMIVSGS